MEVLVMGYRNGYTHGFAGYRWGYKL